MAHKTVPNQQPAPSGLQFNLIPVKDLAKGIDARSAESNVQDGYCEDLVNVDTVSTGQVQKRKGYQGYGGYLPMRVAQVSHDGYQISFKLASAINLSGVQPSPLVVYGRYDHSESGDFSSTASVHTYPTFSVDVRDIFTAASSPEVKAAADTGVHSAAQFVYTMDSTSEQDASSTWVMPNYVQIDTGTWNTTISYLPSATERVYVEVIDKTALAGASYVADYSGSPIVLSGGTISGSIPAATHGLGNFNIIPRFYSLSGSTLTGFEPNSFLVDSSTGDVSFSWPDTANFTGVVILASAPANQFTQTGVAAASTGTIVIASVTTAFPYWALYRLTGSTWEKVLPDSLAVDATAQTLTVTIINSSTSPETYSFYYDFVTIPANTIRVVDTAAVSTTYTGTTITNPQLTIWGIAHSDRYSSSSGGHVVHLDSYKREAEARLVAGLGGNLYAARTRAEIGGAYYLPALSANLSARIASNVSLAPLFQPTGTSTSLRSRGIITGDDVSNGFAVVTGVSFVSAGVADFTLSLANMGGTLALGSQVATSDALTVTGMAHAVHNGTFQVVDVPAQTGTTVTIRVTNPALLWPDFDEAGSAGSANVFTDNITTSVASNFVHGDAVTGGSIPATVALTVQQVTGTTVTLAGVTQPVGLANGLQVFGARVTACVPLKDSSNTASAKGLVKGDMLAVTGLTRQPRVRFVNPFHDMAVQIAVTGGMATVSLGAPKPVTVVDTVGNILTCPSHGLTNNDPVIVLTTGSLPNGLRADSVYFASVLTSSTLQLRAVEGGAALPLTSTGSGTLTIQRPHNLSTGQLITISQTGDHLLDGVQTVLAVPDRSTFTFATATSTTSASGVMVGRSVELDETLRVADALSAPTMFSVDTRWIPVESPVSTVSTLPKSAYTSYFQDTSDIMRSCVVGGNMYLCNGVDPVMKFDGTNLYQAGLFRWQPHLFAEVDTSVTSLALDSVSGTVGASTAGNKFALSPGDGAQYQAGDRVVHSADSAVYTVQSVQTGVSSATSDFVYVSTTISGSASGTLKKVKTYHYYARLNAIDANNNVIASATTGTIDLYVELSVAGQIRLRLLGMPAWGVYDYDRLELQLYRAVANTTAPFYRIRSVPVTFNPGAGYIDIYDGTTDDVLVQSGNLDETNTALKGAELGTAWEQPPVANFMCAVNNKLILANIIDYPQLDLVLRKKSGVASLATSDLAGLSVLLRKGGSSDTGTATDMVTRAKYVFVNSGAVTIVPANITRTSSTFTVPTASPPAVGAWVYLFQSAVGTTKSLQFAGWFQVASRVAGTSFTVNFTNSYTPSSADVDRFVTAATTTDVPVWLGTDGNYSALKFGNTTLSYEGIAAVRLANAINASMVATDTTQAAFAGFVPWVTANAGSEYTLGQVSLRTPKYTDHFLSATLGTVGTNLDVYANNVRSSSAATVYARALVFPSRVVISYQNYPETFDAPAAALQTDSDSVVDVNSADGDAITGIMPFFGQSAFTSSQVENLVVVFKTNSIYILDLATRQIQKIDSQGLGCTAPYSIAATRTGIMFANLSGIYRLNPSLSVSYAGMYLERLWRDNVNADALALATGTNYGIGRQYRLSVPYAGSATNNVVMVYDHTREVPAYANVNEGFGAWTRYTNHAATGWCNLNSDAFFSTSDGQVYKIRRANDATDYRDDAGPVDTMSIVLRALDGGLPGVRKACRAVITHMRMEKTAVTGTVMAAATENSNSFATIGTIVKSFGDRKVTSFRSNLPTSRFTYLTLRYTNSVKDEEFVLAGVDLLMAVLGTQGLAERTSLT